ncbi:H-NS family nucleoid-associated regulatory protein [Reyranella sp.]|uniref:H-NS histone family protein n=1 Tax=Reyranella sp. TaxID=1929291 RepID=UPI003D12429F
MPRRSTAAAIHAQIRMLEKQARKLEMGATKGLRAAAKVIAKHGLSMKDLKEAFSLSRGKNKRSVARSKVAIKYSDGNDNTWTGRGRTPLWLVAAEKAGKKREMFLVGAAKSKAKPKRSKAPAKKAAPVPLQTAA